jgi:hypothetical protein
MKVELVRTELQRLFSTFAVVSSMAILSGGGEASGEAVAG